jgi:hypothetical protein
METGLDIPAASTGRPIPASAPGPNVPAHEGEPNKSPPQDLLTVPTSEAIRALQAEPKDTNAILHVTC